MWMCICGGQAWGQEVDATEKHVKTSLDVTLVSSSPELPSHWALQEEPLAFPTPFKQDPKQSSWIGANVVTVEIKKGKKNNLQKEILPPPRRKKTQYVECYVVRVEKYWLCILCIAFSLDLHLYGSHLFYWIGQRLDLFFISLLSLATYIQVGPSSI